jgi:hypothetical protein
VTAEAESLLGAMELEAKAMKVDLLAAAQLEVILYVYMYVEI